MRSSVHVVAPGCILSHRLRGNGHCQPGGPSCEERTASRAHGTDNRPPPQPSAAGLAMAWVLRAQQEGAQLPPGLEWLPGALL